MKDLPEDLGTAAHAVLAACIGQIYPWGVPARASDFVGQTIEVTDQEHAFLSPSGAKTWMACPAAPHMQKDYPAPAPLEKTRSVIFNEEYAAAVQTCLDYIAKRVAELEYDFPGGRVVVSAERKVDPGEERCAGTLDVSIEAYNATDVFRLAEVVDFKAGAVVDIPPNDPQLEIYLLGLTKDAPPDNARLTVVQPRSFKNLEKIRWLDIEHAEAHLGEIAADMMSAVEQVDKNPEGFNPSAEICKLCSARGACHAAIDDAFRRAGILAPEQPLPSSSGEVYETMEGAAVQDTRALSPAQMVGLLDGKDVLMGLLKATEAYAQDLVWRGIAPAEITQAYKLARGRSSRQWKEDEDETFKRLKRIKIEDPDTQKMRGLGKKDLYRQALKSAPQVEKILVSHSVPKSDARWDAFKALIDQPEGALTLVPRSDKRPEVQGIRVDPNEAFSQEAPNN